MEPVLIAFTVLVFITAGIALFVRSLDGDQKKRIQHAMNDVFYWAEDSGRFPKEPAFNRDYDRDYPQFKLLEDNYPVIREECELLLGIKDHLTDIEVLGGGYTKGGIHDIKWKSFMFKSGEFLEENCARAPKTAALLRQLPDVYTVFFSIIDPKQYVTPHWGYYKGFLRYHLGVIIPENNANEQCWLRVNPNVPRETQKSDRQFIDDGEKYYWKNGEGVIFDDTALHDARNDSDEVRVVMWIDVRRKMPWWLSAFNRFCLWIAHRDASIKRIRRNATVTT